MNRETDIQDVLCDLGYSGPLLDDSALAPAVQEGLTSRKFVALVTWLTEQTGKTCRLEETVSAPQADVDVESFRIELSGFLKELGCPHQELTRLDLDGVTSEMGRWQLLEYLTGELAASRILAINQTIATSVTSKQVPLEPSDPVGGLLGRIVSILQLSQPPPTVALSMIFNKLEGKVKEALSEVPNGHVGAPLLVSPLQTHQLAKLEKLNSDLSQEYAVRRKMLLKRVDVTVQSFKWSDKAKGKEDELQAIYQNQRRPLKEDSLVTLAQLFAARTDLTSVVKTSGDSVREYTRTDINKIMMGKVPDRGGRPYETRPAAEMPTFKKRTEAPKDQRAGGWRGQRGGRVQGGWSGKGKRGDWSRQDSGGRGGGGGRWSGGGHQGGYSGEAGGGGQRSVYYS